MTTECVIEGRPMNNGYSCINIGGKRVYAHRRAWERAHGEIPPGLHVHHLCRNKRCSNVEHLQLLTPAEHMALNRRCEHEDRHVAPSGRNYCRTCHNAEQNARRRERYRTDSVYRAKMIARSVAYGRRKRRSR